MESQALVETGELWNSIGSTLDSSKLPGSMMQLLQAVLLAGEGTPEARKAIQVVLGELDKLATDVKLHHNSTQQEYTLRLGKVRVATTETGTLHDIAHGKDSLWVGCMSTEKTKRGLYEVAAEAYTTAREDEMAKCKKASHLASLKADLAKSTFQCSHAVTGEGSCNSKFHTFNHSIHLKATKLAGSVRVNVEHWKVAWYLCTNATQTRITAQNNMKITFKAWEAQRASCAESNGTRVVTECQFWDGYVHKCNVLDSLLDLKGKIETVGDIWSDPDRRQEWAAIAMAHCFLDKVLKNATLNETECHQQLDYNTSVGVLNMPSPPDQWLCQQTTPSDTVTLNGSTWEVDKEFDYTKKDRGVITYDEEEECSGKDREFLAWGCSNSSHEPDSRARWEDPTVSAGSIVCCDTSKAANRRSPDGECFTPSRIEIIGSNTTINIQKFTYQEATDACKAAGQTLCEEQAELDTACSDTCGINRTLVWIKKPTGQQVWHKHWEGPFYIQHIESSKNDCTHWLSDGTQVAELTSATPFYIERLENDEVHLVHKDTHKLLGGQCVSPFIALVSEANKTFHPDWELIPVSGKVHTYEIYHKECQKYLTGGECETKISLTNFTGFNSEWSIEGYEQPNM